MKKFSRAMEPYFIAEVGQNHNGSLKEALEYVRIFASMGASAVKFQTRDNKYLFSEEAYNAPYNSENAFGATYGEHREFLELSPGELSEVKAACVNYGVDFMSTPFDEPSVDLLIDQDIDLFKVASFDLGNLAMLQRLVDSGKPIVLSVGGGSDSHIEATIEFLLERDADFAVLHCVSKYPCPADELRLSRIGILRERYPDVCVGSSDHFSGTLSGPVAFMLGARVFEKHVTLNRAQKGTDQAFSLEPKGFQDFVRDIKRVDGMLLDVEPQDLGSEPVFKKLGKSIVAARDLDIGAVLTPTNLSGKIFTTKRLPVREMHNIIGKRLVKSKHAGEAIDWSDVER